MMPENTTTEHTPIGALDLNQRIALASSLKKHAFSNRLKLPDIPQPGDPFFDLVEEIKVTQEVFTQNKANDEAWMAMMCSSDSREYLPALTHWAEIKAQVNVYNYGLETAKQSVRMPKIRQILKSIKEKYSQADRQFASFDGHQINQEQSMIDRVATRLLYFDGAQFFSDMDKTLTDSDAYLALLPHAMQFEHYLDLHGRESLPFVMARYARPALIAHEKVYKKIGSTLKFRPGVPEFVNLTKQNGITISVLSANFKAIVASCMENLHADNLISITGLSSNDITATDKETTTAQHILQNPNLAALLCIDGLSDTGCLEGIVKGATAGMFVLAGTDFVNDVEKTGQPFFEFNDFHDVNRIFIQILQRKAELQESVRI